MHHLFRTLLSRFLKETGWTQQNLADRLGTDQATVSRWLSGRVEVSSEAMGKLLHIAPPERRSELLEAFLRDRIPTELEHLIELRTVKLPEGHVPLKQSSGPEFPEVVDTNLKRRLVFFCHLALQSPEVRKLIDLVFKLANGRRSKVISRIELD
jgi:transcriptional regulator with XRE-family HTH domain